MKLDFAKNVKRNMLANAVNNGVKMFFPFLNRTLFLWLLGSENLGLNGLFTSILGVLMLAELGFGQAVVCSMYKPVADDNRELLCAYLKFYRAAYRWVGIAIFSLGMCLLPFLRQLVHGSVPADVDLHILYIIHLVNTSASYFLFAYRGVVLGAHHRNDVVTNIRTAVSVAQYIVVFLILLITRNYYHYVIATVAFTVLQNVLMVSASRRLFPDIEPRGVLSRELRRKVVSDIKSIFLHKVGGVIVVSVDNLVISAFLGLVAVAAYGNYYYVVTTVAGLASIFSSSMAGGFGNKLYTESREKNFELLMRMEKLLLVFSAWCAALMMALYQPFIVIWTKGDATLVRHALTPVLMVLYFYVNQMRQMLLSFKSGAGIWKQDRWKPIVSGAVNLTVNVTLVTLLPDAYKLDGVILSTIVAYTVVEMHWETHAVFASVFSSREERQYWSLQFRYALSAAAVVIATWMLVYGIPGGTIPFLALRAAAAAVIAAALLFALLRKDVTEILRACLSRRSFAAKRKE